MNGKKAKRASKANFIKPLKKYKRVKIEEELKIRNNDLVDDLKLESNNQLDNLSAKQQKAISINLRQIQVLHNEIKQVSLGQSYVIHQALNTDLQFETDDEYESYQIFLKKSS